MFKSEKELVEYMGSILGAMHENKDGSIYVEDNSDYVCGTGYTFYFTKKGKIKRIVEEEF